MQTNSETQPRTFSFRGRISSIRFALEGIRRFFSEEHNAWIHLAATITVFFSAWWFRTSAPEKIALVVVVGLVWIAEIFNTAIERLADLVEPGFHPTIKLIKDLAAAAVLLAAIIAVITGAFIFIPKLF